MKQTEAAVLRSRALEAAPRGEPAEVMLVPDSDHCIANVARREYRSCVETCLQTELPGQETATRLETLRRFLEQADFPRLRRESEPLLRAGRRVRFRVVLDGEVARWRMEEAQP
jgi:hypothetical protein